MMAMGMIMRTDALSLSKVLPLVIVVVLFSSSFVKDENVPDRQINEALNTSWSLSFPRRDRGLIH